MTDVNSAIDQMHWDMSTHPPTLKAGTTPVELAHLADVNPAGITDGQTLIWDVATGKYVASDAGAKGAKGDPGTNGTNGTNGADGVIQSVVAGTNVTVDDTDPANPIVSATGGGGGGSVDSVVAGTGISVDASDPTNPVVSLPAASLGDILVCAGSIAGADLALAFGTAYAVANAGRSPGDAIDNNDGSFWQGTLQWGLDFGSPRALNRIRILWYDDRYAPTAWHLEGSNDSTDGKTDGTWTFVVNGTASTVDDTLDFGLQAWRWWRVVRTGGISGGGGDAIKTFNAYVVETTWAVHGGDAAWTDIQGGVGFQNSWADAGGSNAHSGFRKDALGRVDFRLNVKSGATGSVVATLPAGYRPAADNTFTGQAELVASDVPVELLVKSDGTCTITFVGSLTGNVYVTGNFWAGQ